MLKKFLLALVLAFQVTTLLAKEPTIADVSKDSDTVIVGVVESVTPRWDTNTYGDKLIISNVKFNIEETLKGVPGITAYVDVEGGTVNGITLTVSDMTAFHNGDRAVLFLKRNGKLSHRGDSIFSLDKDNNVKGKTLHLNDIKAQVK